MGCRQINVRQKISLHYTLVDGCAYCIPDCHTR